MSAKWHGEVELPREQSDALREEIHAFIAGERGERGERSCFLTTLRRDGRPLTRPVNALVTDWSVETVTQDIQYKTGHVRANPIVSYLWVSAESRPGFRVHAPRSVFLEGRARLLEHPASVEDFFRRRVARGGRPEGTAHQGDPDYRRYLIRTRPVYVRAEGFAELSRPAVLRDFPAAALDAGGG